MPDKIVYEPNRFIEAIHVTNARGQLINIIHTPFICIDPITHNLSGFILLLSFLLKRLEANKVGSEAYDT